MPKYVVRFGSMRTLGVLSTRGGDRYARGNQVVARTKRGLEVGNVLCEATSQALSTIKDPTHGQILRSLTAEDDNEHSHIQSQEPSEFETCNRVVKELDLDMELVELEH
ncbi:MAG: PSP1 C-terminal domain-containing protein, partial [Pirellulaceae bacterium]|nr:PSP1 C-terminal domain-containing protein [Pirellulaceae bacterium]